MSHAVQIAEPHGLAMDELKALHHSCGGPTRPSRTRRHAYSLGSAARWTGTTPDHTGRSTSSGSSSSGPLRTFADASSIGSARIDVAFSSCSVGCRASSHRPGASCSVSACSACALVLRSLRGSEEDDAAVVDAVVEDGLREHEPVEDRRGQADRRTPRPAAASCGWPPSRGRTRRRRRAHAASG